VLARRWFWMSFTLFLVCCGTTFVGFPTCDTEHGTCPAWHGWMNLVAVIGGGISLLLVMILGLMLFVEGVARRNSRRHGRYG
jgi:hypothetical protein